MTKRKLKVFDVFGENLVGLMIRTSQRAIHIASLHDDLMKDDMKNQPPCAGPKWLRATIMLVFAAFSIFQTACGPSSTHATSSPELDHYRKILPISQVQSYYYTEPESKQRYVLVRGTLTNLGSESLIVVELTLKFKDSTNETIFEDHAYPVFVSNYSHSDTEQPLGPGQKTRFAFKSPKCPENWQAGNVEIEITKVVPFQHF
ncbi:MAG: hypothetical protein U0V70_18745 [Terriglobia bacterium]